MSFAHYGELSAWLQARGQFHMELTLSRVSRCFERLGLCDPPFAVLHVVGTNGKGTTAAYLAALARSAGLRSGLYTSPHLIDVRERIRIDGANVSREALLAAGNRVLPLAEELSLTYFEFLTVAAAAAFARAGVEVAVMEAGLGGRYDAVSALGRDALVLTPVDLDHTAVLGGSLEEIAADKAGAMRPELPATSAPQQGPVRRVLAARAAELGCPLEFAAAALPEEIVLAMHGAHMRANAALARAAWARFAARRGIARNQAAEAAALASVRVPGRMERVATPGGPVLLDGAHNPAGLAALADALIEAGEAVGAVVFSAMADKDLAAMGEAVRAFGAPVFAPPIEVPGAPGRAAKAARLAEVSGARACADLGEALALARAAAGAKVVLVCGSLFLLAEFYRKHPLAPAL